MVEEEDGEEEEKKETEAEEETVVEECHLVDVGIFRAVPWLGEKASPTDTDTAKAKIMAIAGGEEMSTMVLISVLVAGEAKGWILQGTLSVTSPLSGNSRMNK